MITKTVATKVIITFFTLILTLSNFAFNSIYYLQIMGSAMGTICAPAYTNNFHGTICKTAHIYLHQK